MLGTALAGLPVPVYGAEKTSVSYFLTALTCFPMVVFFF